MPPNPDFKFDVFLSHSSKDKPTVRDLARRLTADGLRVWFDESQIRPGDSIPAKIEDGLENSRILILCMSAAAFGSEWTQLESHTFRFRDPLNKDRRFIPLRLDDTPIKGSLAQFLFINWLPAAREQEYPKLLESCRLPAKPKVAEVQAACKHFFKGIITFGHMDIVRSVAFSANGKLALSGSDDKTLHLRDIESGRCLRILEGHKGPVYSVSFSSDSQRALSGSSDMTVRMWEVQTGRCLRVLEGHTGSIWSVVFSHDGQRALSGSRDHTIRLWDSESGRCQCVLKGHTGWVRSVSFSSDSQRALSGSGDHTVRLWDLESGRCLRVLEGHTGTVLSVSFSHDGQRALSGSADHTVRLWDLESGRCMCALRGHTDWVNSVSFSAEDHSALSGSEDNTIRLWDIESACCQRVLEVQSGVVLTVAFSTDGHRALSGLKDGTLRLWDLDSGCPLSFIEGHTGDVLSMSFSPDGLCTLSGSEDKTVRLWNIESGRCLHVLEGHTGSVCCVSFSADGHHALSGSLDRTVRLWDLESGRCLHVLEGHTKMIHTVSFSADGQRALSGSGETTFHLWDLKSGRCLRVLEDHIGEFVSMSFSPNGHQALSGSKDKTVRLWDLETGRCLHILEGHTGKVWSVSFSADGLRALSGSEDRTVRLWDIESGRCLRILEGHTGDVLSVSFSSDGHRALSGSSDKTVRLWDIESGHCLCILEGHTGSVWSVSFSINGLEALSGAVGGEIFVWKFRVGRWDIITSPPTIPIPSVQTSQIFEQPLVPVPNQVLYTNAKVLLVGDSGVGKTGLSNYLARGIKVEDDKPLPSTDGAWATHWPLPHTAKQKGVDREIWLWDFAGQVDYRLVHLIFMDDTSAAILVFNPQNENPFEGLGRWDRDLQKATRKPFAKLLVAGRQDRGGLVVSRVSMDRFIEERGFLSPLHETSAKTGEGCDKLRKAVVNAIDWKSIPETTSPAFYLRMKQEILRLRDNGLILIRLAELKQRMDMTLQGEHFELAELETAVSLLSGPGMIQRLDFGGFILLRPEIISRYAAAVVRKVRKHPQELGCIREDELLSGDLDYQDFHRLPPEDESVILRTLYETFVKRAWCLRQACDGTAMLTFPSYFRRERKDQPSHPSVLVTYRFTGPVDDIYSTLVVRLHHTVSFETEQLWRFAADFKTQTGARLGLKLTRETEGTSLIEAYFEPKVDENSRLVFLRYVHDHLTQHAQNVVRLRHYFCRNKKCDAFGQMFTDRSKIDKALAPGGKGKIFCTDCGKPILLRDVMEQKFDSSAVKEDARKLQEEGQAVIDNESRELILVGHAFSIAGEAGQIYRGYTNSDHGIDGEIEFKDFSGKASGKRLYLQLKSGDSYLYKRQSDNTEIFKIKNPRWVDYWQQQSYPVMLVIRTSDEVIRWMDVSDYLKRHTHPGKKPVKQVIFEGESFTASTLVRWRDKLLRS